MGSIVYLVASYLLGSVSTGIVVCRLLGKGDPRDVGSGNPGATNVLRAYGKGAAAATLFGDVAKGWLPVMAGIVGGASPAAVAGAGLAAFLGHLYPIFFGFRGGKGVATQIGVLLGLNWRIGSAFIVSWLVVAAVTRYSSLAALIATALMPPAALLLGMPLPTCAALTAMALAVFWRHRENIRRLRSGTESRIGAKRS